MCRVTLSPEEKQALILASFREEISVADLCRRAQVAESTFRDWRDRFMAAGTTALYPVKSTPSDGEKQALRQENARLKTVVADLSVENLAIGVCQPLILWITWVRSTQRVTPVGRWQMLPV